MPLTKWPSSSSNCQCLQGQPRSLLRERLIQALKAARLIHKCSQGLVSLASLFHSPGSWRSLTTLSLFSEPGFWRWRILSNLVSSKQIGNCSTLEKEYILFISLQMKSVQNVMRQQPFPPMCQSLLVSIFLTDKHWCWQIFQLSVYVPFSGMACSRRSMSCLWESY